MAAGKEAAILKRSATLLLLCLLASSNALAPAQTHTTGRIAGTVADQTGAVIGGAEVIVTSRGSGDDRKAITDGMGNYSVSLLPPGNYVVIITATGFRKALFENISVAVTETTLVDAQLDPGTISAEIVIQPAPPLIQTDSPQLGRVIGSRLAAELPLATRNITQLFGLSAGTTAYLPDGTVVGRNPQSVSVNGARVSQNNYQINGVDANAGLSGFLDANPAPEAVAEFKVQTSLYDATYGRTGGGNVQVITRSGTNEFHGSVYDYFRDTALNANDAFLKAAGSPRPALERNVYGATIGGPIQNDRAFFFGSYQGTSERNGASRLNSLSVNVLIDPRLTGDRSESALRAAFGLPSIHPTALALLSARLPTGQFLIPTPQTGGRYSGSSISRFHEEQFNSNFDYRINQSNSLSVKFFFWDASLTLARAGVTNVPGFDIDQDSKNSLLAIRDIHSISAGIINESRIGYNLIRLFNSPRQPLKDSEIGIHRSTAGQYPGLPAITIAQAAGGITIGAGGQQDGHSTVSTATLADIISITRGPHALRIGAEARYYQLNITAPVQTRGRINFLTFADFLTGVTFNSIISSGITDRSLRTTDYNLIVQDDWKLSSKLTLNMGLRYELDLPPYDTRGRIATFDPSLYRPRPLAVNGNPVGPPIAGFVQAGNVIARYDMPGVPNVSRHLLKSIDPNNFAPRVGLAYSPFRSNQFVARAGYGIFYSRSSFAYLIGNLFSSPFYLQNNRSGAPFADPFAPLPPQNQFPTFVIGRPLFGLTFDRNNRTPYIQQYNASVQYAAASMMVEVAYAGTRGLNLFRQVAINQARLASAERPVINEVTGAIITTNTPSNAGLRAPFQGVGLGGSFTQDQTSAQSVYHSLQLSLTRRLARGLQFLASYTYARSIDNASGTGGGSGTNGLIDTAASNDSSIIVGNQLDNRAQRGVSDFDRTHRFVLSYLWEFPEPDLARQSKAGRLLFSRWQVAGIITAMSGLPIDVVDGGAGTFYLGTAGGGARPDFAPGASRRTATSNVPPGYFFNPFAFARPIVLAGQVIRSSGGTAIAGATGTDFGGAGRNILRGPRQSNVDFSVIKRFFFGESRNVELKAEFFNLLNQVNLANPISNLNAVVSSGGSIDPASGRIIVPGDFGRIISTSNNPRIIQLAVKLNY
jgi:hypothetical protein